MAETLKDVIERLKKEGQLTRNSGTNSIKSISQKIEVLTPIFQSIQSNLELQSRVLLETLEDQKRKDELDSLRRNENDRGGKKENDTGKKEDESSGVGLAKLGTLGGAFSLAVGSTIGVLAGQLNAIKTYFKSFFPNLTGTFDNFKKKISKRFVNLLDDLKIRFSFVKVTVADVFNNAVKNIKSVFSVSKTSNIGKLLIAFKDGLKTITEPFKVAISTIGNILSSTTKVSKTFGIIRGFLSSLGSAISKVAGVVGKIFAPIAIITTAFETVRGAIQGYADGGILGGLKGAIDGFFTSLITVPLDLVKDLVAWVVGKFGFDETSEAISSFSFTDLFKNMTSGIFGFLSDAVEWVNTLFTDPTTALSKLWNAYVGEGGVLDILWTPVSLAIDWVTKKFGWRDEDAPTFNLLSYIKDVWGKVRETVIEKFQQLTDYISTVPDRVKLYAEGMFVDVSEKLKIGFLTLGNWIASIPARIKLMALNAIRSATSGLPEWAQIVSQSDVDEAQQKVNNKNSQLKDSISEIKKSAQKSREDIERRRRELDAVEENAVSERSRPVLLNYSPNIAPSIQQSVQGGTVSTQNSVFGGGSGSLNFGLPGAAQ